MPRSSAMPDTSQADSIDMRLVLAIDLLDMPCSRSSMMSSARIFLAMLLSFLGR
jgi:hypothetical protein